MGFFTTDKWSTSHKS